MKIALLADIHESNENLKSAIDRLSHEAIDRWLVLGDIFETGERILETVHLLKSIGAEGVWGNHDYGICGEVSDEIRSRFDPEVLEYASRLRPKLRIEDLLFQHIEPWLNPERLEDLWYFEGKPQSAEQIRRGFAAGDHRISFHGHYHCWLVGTEHGMLPWHGTQPIQLAPPHRYMVVIQGVVQGYCATYDTETNWLTPLHIGTSEG